MSDMNLSEILDQIEARANAATPEPWECENSENTPAIRVKNLSSGHVAWIASQGIVQAEQDSTFIAAARSNVPNLIAGIRLALPHIPEATQLDIAKLLQVKN